MRPLTPLLLAVLGACATPDLPAPSYTARFPDFPAALFLALEKTCTDPAQDYARISRNLAECRTYLDPESTAAAILTYDGTPEDLPQLVTRFTARPDGGDYLMKTDAFLNVPQKSRGAIQVVFPSHRFDRELKELYRLAGGVPE